MVYDNHIYQTNSRSENDLQIDYSKLNLIKCLWMFGLTNIKDLIIRKKTAWYNIPNKNTRSENDLQIDYSK